MVIRTELMSVIICSIDQVSGSSDFVPLSSFIILMGKPVNTLTTYILHIENRLTKDKVGQWLLEAHPILGTANQCTR